MKSYCKEFELLELHVDAITVSIRAHLQKDLNLISSMSMLDELRVELKNIYLLPTYVNSFCKENGVLVGSYSYKNL